MNTNVTCVHRWDIFFVFVNYTWTSNILFCCWSKSVWSFSDRRLYHKKNNRILNDLNTRNLTMGKLIALESGWKTHCFKSATTDGGINNLFLLAWSILQRYLDLDNRTSRGILWNKRISSIIHVRRQLTHREKSIDELSMWKVFFT